MTIWYHGTTRTRALSILRGGFNEGTYFAKHLEDALEFGGPYVFAVTLPKDWTGRGRHDWQMVISSYLPLGAIQSCRLHSVTTFALPKRHGRTTRQ